ncbi:hypothetical protein RJT34_27078 [Clitoria ternatea]|uniref:OVATE domain-containing protein n=1 Tax=Clitoria ternatea TaxID=43366 RepID=A0AAN9I8D1_CLITE
MLLRSSISSTKKFFQKTIKNFKSFFSPGYQRLPKASPHNPFSAMELNSNTSYQDTDKLYTDFSDQWESEKEKTMRRIKKKDSPISSSQTKQENNEVYHNGSYISLSKTKSPSQKKNKVVKNEECDNGNNKRGLTIQKGRPQQDSSSSPFISIGMKEHRYCMVEQKLRELEMLDMNNVEYILDIEEVLHYYSRLTCPAYVEIVDKFFMEMYSELFGAVVWPATPCSVNSRIKLRYQ